MLLLLVLAARSNSIGQTLCNDPAACNFGSQFDECFYGQWQRPLAVGSGPAIYECLGFLQMGYTYTNQQCMIQVVDSDAFCAQTSWDGLCDAAYLECCPNQDIWIPNVLQNGYQGLAPLITCGTPTPGYILPDQVVLWGSVILPYPECFSDVWSPPCQSEFNLVAYGCAAPSYYIPLNPASGENLFFGCVAPSNSYYNANDVCVIEVYNNDFFCIESSWDQICQDAYDDCTGCPQNVYIPDFPTGVSAHVIYDLCEPPPVFYGQANVACVAEVIAISSQCATYWDIDCYAVYFECLGFCEELGYYIPIDYFGSNEGATLTCSGTFIPGIIEVFSQECFLQTLTLDPDCAFGWTEPCQVAYEACIGCQLNWYYPITLNITPGVQGCSLPANHAEGYQPCMENIAINIPYCFAVAWDNDCMQAYTDCYEGCTYPNACNYSALVGIDNGSCIFPGCMNPLALNYDPFAGCDNGSCILEVAASCPGDLNNDNVVNISDLTLFLSYFGNSCLTP